MPGGVQGYDRYAYVNNNPVRYVDPSGHMIDEGDGSTSFIHPDVDPEVDDNKGGGGKPVASPTKGDQDPDIILPNEPCGTYDYTNCISHTAEVTDSELYTWSNTLWWFSAAEWIGSAFAFTVNPYLTAYLILEALETGDQYSYIKSIAEQDGNSNRIISFYEKTPVVNYYTQPDSRSTQGLTMPLDRLINVGFMNYYED